jgi:hypothetical protein
MKGKNMTDEEAFFLGFKGTWLILAIPLAVFITKAIIKSNKEIKEMTDNHTAEERTRKQRDIDDQIDEVIEDNELRIYLNRTNKKDS